jgi:2-methylcitrate dehydratase PrpD
MSIIELIAAHLVGTNYESLSDKTVEVTKKQILDTLAATIGGSTCSISGEIEGLAETVKSWGGRRESSLVGFGGRVPAPQAAFLNGVLAVRLDFDDTHVRGFNIHISRGVVPTALAMAERQRGISGKELITAVALGHDLSFRLRQAGGNSMDSAFGMITNFFGAAASAGKILGLNAAQFGAAMGLTFHQLSGAQSSPGTAGAGASIKGLNNGVACKTGIISCLLAEKGFTGSLNFLEETNKRNFYQTFFRGVYLPQYLTADLGKTFNGIFNNQKEYPCCHGQHTAIEATLNLIKRDNIQARDVAEVLLRISPGDYDYLASPSEKKKSPQNIIETQFSIYWGVASAICYGETTIRNFSASAYSNKNIWEMLGKVSARPEPEFTKQESFTPVIVEIKTRDGSKHSGRLDYPFGSTQNPMTMKDTAAKFKHCCRYSARPIPEENQDKVISLFENLERVKDVGRISRLVSG